MAITPAPVRTRSNAGKSRVSRMIVARTAREYFLLATLAVVLLVVSVGSQGNFWQQSNLTNFFISSAIIAIPAAGMTMVILTGGIDVSIGSMFGLTAAMGGWMFEQGYGAIPGCVVFVLAGALLGAINGVIITYGRVTPIIATLGTLSIFRTAVFILLGNHWITNVPASLTLFFMLDKVWVVPLGAVMALVVMAVFAWFLARWPMGRHLYAVGNNEEAARLAGINVRRIKLFAYIAVGALVGLATPISLGLSPMVQTSTGTGFELTVIAAVVLGGTELTGGRGSILGTLLGTLLVGLVQNGVVLLHIQPFWSGVILGLIILVSVAFAQRRGERENA